MMKKFMFFALASAAMLASCSSDDQIAVDESNVAADDPVAIQIGVGQIASATTRGTGTVGGTLTEGNVWAGEKFNLYMLKKGTMDLATKNNLNTELTADAIFNNSVFVAPNGTDKDYATPSDGKVYYYPASGVYDFWGYRLDGAEGTAEPTMTATDITIPFKIDGSEDILVAKAIPDDTDKDASHLNGHVEYAYSAKAARKNVQPKMTFRHLLSRLKFTVAPGNESTADAASPVVITAIKAKSAVNGTLTIAATGDTDGSCQAITWGTAVTDSALVEVMDRAAANTPVGPLAEVSLANKWTAGAGTYSPVGEALLVSPSADDYELVVEGYQDIITDYDMTDPSNPVPSAWDHRTFSLALKAPAPVDNTDPSAPVTGFQAGTSYNVQIIVYGLEQIKVYVTLTPWEEVTLEPIGGDEAL